MTRAAKHVVQQSEACTLWDQSHAAMRASPGG
jgi:hypothetical protein